MFTSLEAVRSKRGSQLLASTAEAMVTGRGNSAVDGGKMTRDLEDVFETNLKTLLDVTEKSGNLRKDLRDDIMKSVSSLRGIYNTLMANLEEKTKNRKLRKSDDKK
jgi:hypothetical protein